MRVRPATAADAGAIARVHVRSWQAGYQHLLPAEFLDSLSVDRRHERWSRRLAELAPGEHVFVAVEGSAVRGFADAGPSRDSDAAAETGELATLYVDPDCWRRGAGTSLQGHALEALAGAGFRTAILWVLAANVRALRFYERTGWSAEGKTKYEHHGSAVLHEARYWRTLPLASSGDLPRTSFPAL